MPKPNTPPAGRTTSLESSTNGWSKKFVVWNKINTQDSWLFPTGEAEKGPEAEKGAT
jgi:hypothetical protein